MPCRGFPGCGAGVEGPAKKMRHSDRFSCFRVAGAKGCLLFMLHVSRHDKVLLCFRLFAFRFGIVSRTVFFFLMRMRKRNAKKYKKRRRIFVWWSRKH